MSLGNKQNIIRTHNLGQLRKENADQEVTLCGWIDTKRDHGGILFIDLRDFYGITQVVIENEALAGELSNLKLESVIKLSGKVRIRPTESLNKNLPTGEIEVLLKGYEVESISKQVPFQINVDEDVNEDIRLRHRFLDLRRQKVKDNIVLRSQVTSHLRRVMEDEGFMEIQTPILTSSSPEGARDFIIPSRLHPGKFYALPQAPQQFKQLLMVSGIDRYFQIAPCFRDEDARADRSPGEFYQLDLEMAFATQEDVFCAIEPVLYDTFKKFAPNKEISNYPFKRIAYDDAMLLYGSDKPDLRNPIKNADTTDAFKGSDFSIFAKGIDKGFVVRAIKAPAAGDRSRKFFDDMIAYAMSEGAKGLAYIIFDKNGEVKSPIAKFLTEERLADIKTKAGIQDGDAVFFACAKEGEANRIAGLVRAKLGKELELIDENKFDFCWIVDFPFYEKDEQTNKLEFSHNPFSMPQGGLEALENAKTEQDLLNLKAYQYDIVCNGIELSSGAVRNHRLDIMQKAFEKVGYSVADLEVQFPAMIKAFSYGAPPHAGIAPGLDRMVMLLAGTESIRDVIAFPMNGKAEDVLMGAPCEVQPKALQELYIRTVKSEKKEKK